MGQIEFQRRLRNIIDSFAIAQPIPGSAWIDTPLTPAQARLAHLKLSEMTDELWAMIRSE